LVLRLPSGGKLKLLGVGLEAEVAGTFGPDQLGVEESLAVGPLSGSWGGGFENREGYFEAEGKLWRVGRGGHWKKGELEREYIYTELFAESAAAFGIGFGVDFRIKKEIVDSVVFRARGKQAPNVFEASFQFFIWQLKLRKEIPFF
jgi:hypothetical protein